MKEIIINTEQINLDQLLKWAGIIDNGSHVKLLIQDNLVFVNEKPIRERRKKIFPGDIVEIKGIEKFIVTVK